MKWYFDVIGLDMGMVLDAVGKMEKLYGGRTASVVSLGRKRY